MKQSDTGCTQVPYKIGILSLELTAPQYMIAMLSREVGYKINLDRKPTRGCRVCPFSMK